MFISNCNCLEQKLSYIGIGFSENNESSKKTPLNKEFVMLTAISASGIGRVIGLDTGKDIAHNWAKKKALKLAKNQEEHTLITEKLLKKIKLPVTFVSTLIGVITGLIIILIPAKLYNDKVRRNNI